MTAKRAIATATIPLPRFEAHPYNRASAVLR